MANNIPGLSQLKSICAEIGINHDSYFDINDSVETVANAGTDLLLRKGLSLAVALRIKSKCREAIRKSVQDERKNLFTSVKGKAKPQAPKRKTPFKFFCLSEPDESRMQHPKSTYDMAGLGSRQIPICLDSSANELIELLEDSYPKLKDCGGFDFCRATQGRNPTLIPIPCLDGNGITPLMLREKTSGVIYIRPIQKALSLEKVAISASPSHPSKPCFKCDEIIPMFLLRDHVDSCDGIPPVDKTSEDDAAGEKTDDFEECFRCGKLCCAVELVDHHINGCPMYGENENPGRSEVHEPGPSGSKNDEPVPSVSKNEPQNHSFEIALQKLRQSVVSDPFRISVERDAIVENGMVIFKKLHAKPIDIKKSPCVSFVGEPAIDAGGPFREFVSEFFSLVSKQYFEKTATGHSFRVVDEQIMKLIGTGVAWSILHSGPHFQMLNPYSVRRLLNVFSSEDFEYSELVDWTSMLPENSVFSGIIRRLISDREEEYVDIFNLESGDTTYKVVLSCGVAEEDFVVEKRHKIAQDVLEHALFTTKRKSFIGFAKGLDKVGLFELLKAFPEKAEIVLGTKPVCFSDLMKIIEFITPFGEKQERANTFFRKWMEDGEVHREFGSASEAYGSLLMYGTSSRVIYEDMKLTITYEEGIAPTASTCDQSIGLPVDLTRYDDFKQSFSFFLNKGVSFSDM